jgi:hypothetical protein
MSWSVFYNCVIVTKDKRNYHINELKLKFVIKDNRYYDIKLIEAQICFNANVRPIRWLNCEHYYLLCLKWNRQLYRYIICILILSLFKMKLTTC